MGRPRVLAGRRAIRQWRNPPPGASGSKTVSENEAVCAGGAVHRSAGEMLAPSQVYRFGIVPPWWNAGDVSTNAATSEATIATHTVTRL